MKKIFLMTFLLLLTSTSLADLCHEFSPARTFFDLDTTLINESSGMAASSQYPGRLYHINDSGDGPYFYLTQGDGPSVQKIEVAQFGHYDMEDLSYQNCLDKKKKCLYLADIGDNRRRRDFVQILEVKERKEFQSITPARRTYRVRYPDRARDAEAFAVHPNGDFYLLSKEEDQVNRKSWPARMYRLSVEERRREKEFYEWELVGTIDLPWLMYLSNFWGQMATSMDISADGQKLLVLSYHHAIEFQWDLSLGFKESRLMKEEIDYQIIRLDILPQQEAISYLPLSSSFFYSTEQVGDEARTPVKLVECVR